VIALTPEEAYSPEFSKGGTENAGVENAGVEIAAR